MKLCSKPEHVSGVERERMLSAFHLVSAFMGLSKMYFVKFYMCISFCVHILNVLLHNTFSVIDFFVYEGLPSGLKKSI